MRMLVIAASYCAAVPIAHAEDSTLSLPQVLAVAVRQSPDLERASLDLRVAEGALAKAQGVEDTHIGAAASYQNIVNQPPAANAIPLTSTAAYTSFKLYGVSLSLSKLLPTGGTIALSGNTDYVNEVYFDGTGGLGYVSGATISLTQPLLRGLLGPGAPIRAAKHDRSAADLLQQAKARDAIVAVVDAYWQVALAWRQLEVTKVSLDLAQKQLDFTLGAIRADKVAKSEALAVQEAIAIRQQDVLAAEQQVWDRSLALRQLAGLEISPDALEVKTDALPKADPIELDVATVVKATFDHSAELAALEESERSASELADAADNAARSRLDLAVSAGPQGTADTLGKSIANAISVDGYQVNATLTFDHAIERRTERGGQQEARARLFRAKVEARAGRARIATAAMRAAQRAKAALASVALGEKAIDLAQQNVEAEQHRFELGKSTNFEVLRRQDELQQAKLRHATSMVDFLSARAQLEGLTGTILQKYGVTLH